MTDPVEDTYSDGYHVLDLLAALAESWLFLLIVGALAGLTALGATTLRSTVAVQTWATVTIEAPKTAVADVHTMAFLSEIEQATNLGATLGVPPAQATSELGNWITASTDDADRVVIVLRPSQEDLAEPVMTAIAARVAQNALVAPDRVLVENMLVDYRSALETASNDLSTLRSSLGLADDAVQAPTDGALGENYAALSNLHLVELELKLAMRDLENQFQALPDGTIVSPIMVETTSQSSNVAMPVVVSAVAGLILAAFLTVVRDAWKNAAVSNATSGKVARIRRAFGLRASQTASNAKN